LGNEFYTEGGVRRMVEFYRNNPGAKHDTPATEILYKLANPKRELPPGTFLKGPKYVNPDMPGVDENHPYLHPHA
jgi:hypothetical protein